MQPGIVRASLLLISLLALGACSSGPSSRIDYKEAKSLPTLEMPPHLSYPAEQDRAPIPQLSGTQQAVAQRPSVAEPAATPATRAILPIAEGIRVEQDRSTRWLVIDRPAEQLWPRLRDFWATIGLEVRRDEPLVGIMETDWAENRADAPGGFLTGLVRSVFKNAYSAGTRDKYRLRLEPQADGSTELYLTHYGLQEVVAAQSAEMVETAWVVRPSDPELVHEILNMIIVHLGGEREQATRILAETGEAMPPSRTRLVADILIVNEGFSRTWRRTGIALDEAGLIVEDRNLSDGIYYVSDYDPQAEARGERRGWLRSLFRRSAAEPDEKLTWQVVLAGDEQATRIVVRDGKGNALPGDEATAILKKLAELLQ